MALLDVRLSLEPIVEAAAYGVDMARREPDAVRITTATRSRSDDIGARQRRYVISMTIRTLCFVLAVVCIGHWFMWVFIAGSFVLPYVAVVMANAGAAPDRGGPSPVDPDPTLRGIEGPDAT
jgi:hypothetical protein